MLHLRGVDQAMTRWRWDPLDELVTLRESMEHLFEEMYSCRPPLFRDLPVMWETETAVVFRADLPGADPGGIEVSVSEDALSIRAGDFRRAIALPAAVVPGLTQAAYRDGVLEVRMPKAGTERVRRITVEAA